MMQPATYSMISVLLVSLICYFTYIYNIKYDEAKEIMEKRIQNLTTNYHQQVDSTLKVYEQRFQTIKNNFQTLMAERKYELQNLETTYEREKYFMNSTAYILYAMHVPKPLIPAEIRVNPENFIRNLVKF